MLVWQKAMGLARATYRETESLPKAEIFGLRAQMRRAAVSIPSNIAEGHGRLNTGEYRQFLGVARASNFELQTHLEIARALEFGNAKLLDEAEGLSHEVGKMLFAILDSTKKKAKAN